MYAQFQKKENYKPMSLMNTNTKILKILGNNPTTHEKDHTP